MDQKPSVGRVVHYRALGSADGRFPQGQCRAAIVTEIIDDSHLISLAVLNPSGMYFNLAVAHSDGEDVGTWHWPERV